MATATSTTDNQSLQNGSTDPDCEAFRANLTSLLAERRSDPFEERDAIEPQLTDCGEQRAFLLAAYGLDGGQVLQVSWSFEESTECRFSEGVAATGGGYRYHLSSWDHPEEESTVGFGTGGSSGVFAGQVDTREGSSGRTSWGGGFNQTFEEGRHSFLVAAESWGAWETALTEHAALFVGLVCEEAFSFEGLASPSTLHLFSSGDMDAGAGVRHLAGGSAGLALGANLGGPATLRMGGFALQGAGAVVVDHENGTQPHAVPPGSLLDVVDAVPEGPLRVVQGQGGIVSLVGLVHDTPEQVDAGPIVGDG